MIVRVDLGLLGAYLISSLRQELIGAPLEVAQPTEACQEHRVKQIPMAAKPAVTLLRLKRWNPAACSGGQTGGGAGASSDGEGGRGVVPEQRKPSLGRLVLQQVSPKLTCNGAGPGRLSALELACFQVYAWTTTGYLREPGHCTADIR